MHPAVKTVLLVVATVAVACDRSPTAAPADFTLTPNVVPLGLVACGQSYDSTTRVIGPQGGSLSVGVHTLYVDSLVLTRPETITAVAPAGAVRWVRFRPDGLQFPANPVDGWGAVLYTSYKDCSVSALLSPRIAQVDDALGILTYLQTSVKVRQNPWSQGNQYIAGLLPHFSNYAIAW